MSKLILLALVPLLCVNFGEGNEQRKCVKCKFQLGKIPCYTQTTTCNPGEVCATITGTAIGKFNLITRRDCIEGSKCTVNDTTSFESLSYVTSTVCCDEDFCNSGVGAIRISLLAGLAVLLCMFLVQLL
ncbi:sperm acrosome membrane-associated protein 4-like [Rhinatrema bivittatum]|uniref:sperm acrosome membrane-associated protein 4-like n=1 Tax=Rhinatrema bivittatum TaxID=194408 RepID=UPI0011284E14|nr:sperm acrosome membrane-associated protein 4-like [Rhinatrema bivittatum]